MRHKTLQWYRKGSRVRRRHVYLGVGRRWLLKYARQDVVEQLMLTEYQRLHRGHKHTSIFSKDQRGLRRRQARRFALTQKQQELS